MVCWNSKPLKNFYFKFTPKDSSDLSDEIKKKYIYIYYLWFLIIFSNKPILENIKLHVDKFFTLDLAPKDLLSKVFRQLKKLASASVKYLITYLIRTFI